MVEGVRYGHILESAHRLARASLAAVSVVARLCVVAGSASTIAMLKEEDGPGVARGARAAAPLGRRRRQDRRLARRADADAAAAAVSLRRMLRELPLQRSPVHAEHFRRVA